ncbi:MAG TPA: 3-deoxy-7-phosphoheptulonate synthase [Terriglobales bacterium]|nr:3-deoxy-7-phosphoheptulonate synthase [Terriglobales bacterium]
MHRDWTDSFSCFDKVARTDDSPRTTVIVGGDIEVGGPEFIVMAGPCSVEDERQILETAELVRKCGARILRGGAYKPRSSPYAFQGLGLEALKLLKKAREYTGLAIVTEVMSELDVDTVAEYADILQIGSRSMENYTLLEAAGRSGVPVLLKRGMCASITDLMQSAQVVAEAGNDRIILCERGVRTFETVTRNTLDIAAVPVLHAVSRLPVIVDPSHAAGISELVPALSRSAVAAGADGLLVEVHPHPESALSDGRQSLTPMQFRKMMNDLAPLTALRARTFEDIPVPQETMSCDQG